MTNDWFYWHKDWILFIGLLLMLSAFIILAGMAYGYNARAQGIYPSDTTTEAATEATTTLETTLETVIIEDEPIPVLLSRDVYPPINNATGLKSLGIFKVTAYCPCKTCCGKWAGSKLPNGNYPKEGYTVAADLDVLPRGTVILIEGLGQRTVEDCGSFRGKRLDIFFSSHEEALKWTNPNGHHDLEVFLPSDK